MCNCGLMSKSYCQESAVALGGIVECVASSGCSGYKGIRCFPAVCAPMCSCRYLSANETMQGLQEGMQDVNEAARQKAGIDEHHLIGQAEKHASDAHEQILSRLV